MKKNLIQNTFQSAKKKFLEEKTKLYLVNEIGLSTISKYKTTFLHFEKFLKWNLLDPETIALNDIEKKHIQKLDLFLKTECKFQNNTSNKAIKTIKTFFIFCKENELLEKDLFLGFKTPKMEYKEPIFLTEEKMKRLKEFHFSTDNLNKTRDMFLFQCYTGLAYIDFYLLTKGTHTITKDESDKNYDFWIKGKRQKSNIFFNIPLLPEAMNIINKYNGVANFPLLTNQKYNSNLKQIQNILGFNEYLTTHVARKTCGFFLLNLGVSFEVVANVLGHSDIKTTQQTYARVLTKRVSREVNQALKNEETSKIILNVTETELKNIKNLKY